jgi:hypothetical protein
MTPGAIFESLALTLACASVAREAEPARRGLREAAEQARLLSRQLHAAGAPGMPELLRMLADGLAHPPAREPVLEDHELALLAGWLDRFARLMHGQSTPEEAERLLPALEQLRWLPTPAPRLREYLMARLREAALVTARAPLSERVPATTPWHELDEELHLAMAEFGDDEAQASTPTISGEPAR